MTTWTRLAIASAVILTLAAPDLSSAQARRGSSSSSGSGQDTPSAGPRSSPGGSSGGSAQPRSGPASSGTSQGGFGSPGGRSVSGGSSGQAGPRDRGSRPIEGQARTRVAGRPGVTGPTYAIRSYYPWYGSSFGYYDPWFYGYGYNRWSRYPYVGYGVFGYPFGVYTPYAPYGYYGGGGYRASRQDEDGQRPTGSIRFRVNPSHARVYVDGALVGTVDDFDGFGGHLRLDAGAHDLEIRAEGYETYSAEVTVAVGRTTTARARLKRVED